MKNDFQECFVSLVGRPPGLEHEYLFIALASLQHAIACSQILEDQAGFDFLKIAAKAIFKIGNDHFLDSLDRILQ